MAQDNSTIYGNQPYPGEYRNTYSNEQTEIAQQPAYPGDRTRYMAPQGQQPQYNSAPQYYMGYNQARARQQKKSNNGLLIGIIIASAAVIAGLVVTIILMSNKDEAPVMAQASSAVSTPASAAHDTYEASAPVREETPAERATQVKSVSTSGLGAAYADATLSGMFAGTHYGETASSLPGKAGSMGRGSYKRTTSGGVTYSYVFKHGDARYENPELTSVSLEVSGVSNPWDECDAFDAYLERNGATLAASTSNGRRIYRTPDGYYASSGYMGRKFVVYFYYELFESSIADNAAPRK